MKEVHIEVKFERYFRKLDAKDQRDLLLLLHDIHIKTIDDKTVMERKLK